MQHVGLGITQPLKRGEKERAIAAIVEPRKDYGSAETKAKVVGYLVRLVRAIGAVRYGVQSLILMVFVGGAV